ncbi:hypothetical protein BsWGS_24157 [Bradybaena similaris]
METEILTTFRRNATEYTPTLTLSTTSSLESSTSMLTFDITTLHQNQTTIDDASVLNISAEDRSQYLALLQEQTTKGMIPAMVYLILLAAVGLVGNSLVLFVYSQKFKQTSTRVFILAIASFDIITNVVAIPGEIYDMFHIWDFSQPMICKTRLFFNAFTTMAAAMVLVAVAVVRYRKICKPFKKQVTIAVAQIITIVLAVLSLLFSIPYAIINGRQTKSTPRHGISGFECTIDDSYVGTIWPLINGAFFIFLFIVCSIPLVVMYAMIGVAAWKHSQIYGVTTKGKTDAQIRDSANANEAGTKSTEDAPLKFPMSPKTRSFVKKKGKSSSELPSEKSQKENDDISSGIENERLENSVRTPSSKTQGNDDDIEAIIYEDDKKKEGKFIGNNNNFSARMIRTATGERVNVNMCMVRELTVKLKAVKKEKENRDNDDSGNDSETADVEHEMPPTKLSKRKDEENAREENESCNKFEMNTSRSGSKHAIKLKIHRNHSTDNNLYVDLRKTLPACPAKRFSKSVDDLSRLIEKRPNIAKELIKYKAAEHEDLDLRADSKGAIENTEPETSEEADAPKDEPVSEFAKAMQWVELTYCHEDDKRDSENSKNETNGEEVEPASLSKKGSFAMGRKISRDNSFLQRHRKLKDALSDTLTRARKSKRERETAEAEARDNYGNFGLENINSESENTCTNEDSDLALKATEGKSNNNERQLEDKTYNRKASIALETIRNGEPRNKPRQNANRGRRQGIGRTTAMLILISAVYILGFLPYLGLMFAKSASPATFESMDLAPFAVYNLFLRSYFLNSAANPIIYSLCDINFRRECFALLKCS